jgi:hypothetical protein
LQDAQQHAVPGLTISKLIEERHGRHAALSQVVVERGLITVSADPEALAS